MSNVASVLAATSLALIPLHGFSADLEAYKKALATGDPAPLVAMVRADAGRTPLGPRGESLLHMASWIPIGDSRSRVVAALLAAGADAKAADMDGNRPLHRMYHEALLPAGINVRNVHGFTPLHFAALKGDEKGVRWLLANGADPSAPTTVRYEFHELSPEWKANPEVIEPGTRPYDIALRWHDRTKWSIASHRKTLEILEQATPRRSWYSR